MKSSPRFSVLGRVRAWDGEKELDLGTPQQRALLALLLLRAGRPVPLGELVDELWPADPPVTAANIVHRYVSRLRRVVGSGVLTRSASGYRLDADADSLDLLRFDHLVAAAWAAKATDPDRATTLMTEAVRLWRGPVAADLSSNVRSGAAFVDAERRFAAAALEAAVLATDRGQAYELLPALRSAAAAAPFDEALQAALMRLLAATGRTAEALEHFVALRDRLADKLGVDPSPEVTAVHQALLRGGSGRSSEPPPRRPSTTIRPTVGPAQLPLDPATFSGRTEHVERLTSHLRERDRDTPAGRVAAIVGMGGIGKTSLAVHSAHRVADQFPDGQLYVNMHGFDPATAPMRPHDAVRGLITALGVPESAVPADFDARVALYRSLTARRRILVVLDNVRDADHARPLLPGGRHCAAIVTSRDPLADLLVREGAVPIPLEPMSGDEAEALLAKRLGSRLDEEPDSVRLIIASCGGLPLALSIFSARALTHSHLMLGRLHAELEAARGLDSFGSTDGAHDLRTVFSWSYRLLGHGAAPLFRLLSLHPGQVFGVSAAASLAGCDVARAADLLAELRRANLIAETAPSRYRMHDLVRAYSGELLLATEPAGRRREAIARLLNHYHFWAERELALAAAERAADLPAQARAHTAPAMSTPGGR